MKLKKTTITALSLAALSVALGAVFLLSTNTTLFQGAAPGGDVIMGGGSMDFTVTVRNGEIGSGKIRWNSVDCTLPCTMNVAAGTSVRLEAVADTGSTFQRWRGGCTGTSATCTITVGSALTIYADFVPATTPPTYSLALPKAGTGEGEITVFNATTSTLIALCTPSCIYSSLAAGTQINLTARPKTGSTFAGWSGGVCSGTGNCAVTVAANTVVTATFNAEAVPPSTFTVTVNSGEAGFGKIRWNSTDCALPCTMNVAAGTSVRLEAVANTGSTFQGWRDGGCTGAMTNCIITVDSALTIYADFVPAVTPPAPILTITNTLPDTGTVDKGANGVSIYKVNLQATNESITVSEVGFKLTSQGNKHDQIFGSLKLKFGDSLTNIPLTAVTSKTWDQTVAWTIPVGTTKLMEVLGDIKLTAAGNSQFELDTTGFIAEPTTTVVTPATGIPGPRFTVGEPRGTLVVADGGLTGQAIPYTAQNQAVLEYLMAASTRDIPIDEIKFTLRSNKPIQQVVKNLKLARFSVDAGGETGMNIIKNSTVVTDGTASSGTYSAVIAMQGLDERIIKNAEAILYQLLIDVNPNLAEDAWVSASIANITTDITLELAEATPPNAAINGPTFNVVATPLVATALTVEAHTPPPVGGLAATGATALPVLSFDLAAVAENVTINEITLNYLGDTDISFVIKSASLKLGSGAPVTLNTPQRNTLVFTGLQAAGWTLTAGAAAQTATLTVDIYGTAPQDSGFMLALTPNDTNIHATAPISSSSRAGIVSQPFTVGNAPPACETLYPGTSLIGGVCECPTRGRFYTNAQSVEFYRGFCMPCPVSTEILLTDGVHCLADYNPRPTYICGNNICEPGEFGICNTDCTVFEQRCEDVGLYTYSGAADAKLGLESGVCIECPIDRFKETDGTCVATVRIDPPENTICGDNICEGSEHALNCPYDCDNPGGTDQDNTRPRTDTGPIDTRGSGPGTGTVATGDDNRPSPNLASTPRLHGAPDASGSGPGDLIYGLYGAIFFGSYGVLATLRRKRGKKSH